MRNDNGNRRRVLVTALGTLNCTTIVRELRNSGEDFYIIGADINLPNRIYTSVEVDEFYQFPKATEEREKYFLFVKEFCIEHKVSLYYCVVDEEVELMAKHRKELSSIGVALCVANTEAVILCHNKDKFAKWSETYLPEYCIKRFVRYEDVSDNDFPLFIKPIEGRASIGCVKIQNREELEPYLECWKDYIVQEFTSGEIIAADVVRCRETKQTQICQRLELLRNGNGCGVSVRIVNHSKVEQACQEIADLLDLNGVVNMEFFVNGETVRIIEVNPRIPAGVEYSCMAGLNLIKLAAEIADKKRIDTFASLKIGAYFAKRYETYEISNTKDTNLRLTTFSYFYLKKSLNWLNDPDVQAGMDIHYTITPEMQNSWFERLPYRKDYRIWGVECDGVPIGGCGFRNIQPESGELTCYIGEKDFRGRGLSSLMLQQAETKALELGFKEIKLKVLITNARAISLYHRCGYVEYEKDDKFVKMKKQLKVTNGVMLQYVERWGGV